MPVWNKTPIRVWPGLVVIAGEITTNAQIDYQNIARDTIRKIGYDDSTLGFDFRSCWIISILKHRPTRILTIAFLFQTILTSSKSSEPFSSAISLKMLCRLKLYLPINKKIPAAIAKIPIMIGGIENATIVISPCRIK
jgi:hypothetical protein